MSHTLCLLSELAELEHRLWATNKVVQDTRFRATCAMSGQLVAAQQRTLGTVCEGTRPVNSFLAPELHNPPYSHMYLDQQRCFTTDSKVRTEFLPGFNPTAQQLLTFTAMYRVLHLCTAPVEQSVPESPLWNAMTP